MYGKKLTALLCAAAVMGLMLSGCGSSESSETAEGSTESAQQESAQQESAQQESAQQESTQQEDTQQESAQQKSSDMAGTVSSDENAEITLEGEHQVMSKAPLIPLNTKVCWSAEDDDPRVGVNGEQDRQWYEFETEPGSEDLVYQMTIGGIANDFYLYIYDDEHNDPIVSSRGHTDGANLILDLEGLESEATYYIEMWRVEGWDYYVKVSTVEAKE